MDYLRTGEAARLAGVGLNTVKRWIAAGRLPAVRTPGGHWRIPRKAFERFLSRLRHRPEVGRVLVVDDDRATCALLQAVLEDVELALECRYGHDGCEALVQIGGWQPDLLLVDLFMPRLDGLEVLRRVRGNAALWARMHVIVVTAAFDRPEVKAAMEEIRPAAFLPKPFDVHQLQVALLGCLARLRRLEVA